jgi:hypothetical protein
MSRGRRLRSLDLFSGIGGITRALSGLADPVAYCDWAPDARRVLRSHMASGTLPRAPIASDVRELDVGWLKVKPDIIVGGFPCVGFSEMGLREGFDDSQSGLFSEILRLADATGCPMLFLENVPGVLYLGMPDIVNELVTKRGFELRWCVVAAEDVGAPHKRSRWFCLAVRPGFRFRWMRASAYDQHVWTSRMPPRAIKGDSKRSQASMQLLGNSVVPDAVRCAFLHLVGRCTPAPLKGTLGTPAGWELVPASKNNNNPKKPGHSWPKCGLVAPGDVGAMPTTMSQPLLLRPPLRLNLVFDPAAFRTSTPPSSMISTPMYKAPVKSARWSTPRHGCMKAANYLTLRTVRDLPTQVRFEVNTRDASRSGCVSPAFLEWLMGYPPGWTAAAAT